MMTDEELQEAKDFLEKSEIPAEWRINLGGMIMQSYRAMRKLLAHVDGQASQIAALKTALISDRGELILYSPSYIVWRYQNNIDRIESQDNWKPIEAKAKGELAQEYPDIDWEE